MTGQIKKLVDWVVDIKKRVNSLEIGDSTEKVRMLEQVVEKKEVEINGFRKGEENLKEILNTLTQQNKLYQAETKSLQ